MEKNVGGFDRIARLVVGPVLLVAGIAGYAGWLGLAVGPVPQALAAVIAFLIGAVLVVTGAVQTCPMNRLVGIDTFRSDTTVTESAPEATPRQ